jgi:hypothetical protein
MSANASAAAFHGPPGSDRRFPPRALPPDLRTHCQITGAREALAIDGGGTLWSAGEGVFRELQRRAAATGAVRRGDSTASLGRLRPRLPIDVA